MDLSMRFNNAGVRMLDAGQQVIAMDLFRGALESKLAYERTHRPERPDYIASTKRCVTPDCVTTAEEHLVNEDKYVHHEPVAFSLATPMVTEDNFLPGKGNVPKTPPALFESEPENPTLIRQSGDYLLVAKPFALPLSDCSRTSTQKRSAIIVFNLGLVNQLADASSSKAAAFYEISASLLANELYFPHSNLLRIAILNNFAVWSHAYGDEQSKRASYELLINALAESSSSLDQTVRKAVQVNMERFREGNTR
jgi:hypothetical protein